MPLHGDLNVHVTTKFGAYDIRDAVYDRRPARVLYSSASHTAQSGVAYDDRPELLFDYMERMMELFRALLPKRVLLIGGGAFVLPKAMLEELPDVQLTVVEIDDALPALAEKYFDFKPSSDTRIFDGDGLRFLKMDEAKYDLILIDVFTDETIPAGFQTAATANLLSEHVTSKGVIAMNIIAAYHGPRSTMLRRQITAWQSAFLHLELFPAGHDESRWFPQNFILTAQQNERELAPYLRYAPLPLLAT